MKNKYEVLGIVGEGAYGIVYKCLNKETNKFVAVKKFKETHDKLVQKTMKRELAMLQLLRHENVVEFQESFVSKGNFFLVFEYNCNPFSNFSRHFLAKDAWVLSPIKDIAYFFSLLSSSVPVIIAGQYG